MMSLIEITKYYDIMLCKLHVKKNNNKHDVVIMIITTNKEPFW